jgi:hypothetical protein
MLFLEFLEFLELGPGQIEPESAARNGFFSSAARPVSRGTSAWNYSGCMGWD